MKQTLASRIVPQSSTNMRVNDFSSLKFAACNCDSIGSSDNLCNIQSGQCSCRIKAWGRQCNLCPPSNWGFPLCRPCRCNNHATTCQPKTGFCIDCQHNTAGRNCEVCAIGFYGDATLGKFLNDHTNLKMRRRYGSC